MAACWRVRDGAELRILLLRKGGGKGQATSLILAARAALPPLPAETFVLVLRQAQAVVRRDGGVGLLQFSVKLHTPDIEQVMIPWPRSRLPQDQSHINSPVKAEAKVSPSSTFK